MNTEPKKISSSTFKSYLVLLIGQNLSNFGINIVQFALFWHINVVADDPIAISYIFSLLLVPTIIMTPFIGVLTDIWEQKKILCEIIYASINFLILFQLP